MENFKNSSSINVRFIKKNIVTPLNYSASYGAMRKVAELKYTLRKKII